MKTIMIIAMFFLIGAFFIISEDNIRMNTQSNVNVFFVNYVSWIDSIFSNGKGVLGYVVKMEWLPEK